MIRKISRKVTAEPMTIVTDAAKFSLKGIIERKTRGFHRFSTNINLKYRGYGHRHFEDVVEVRYKGSVIGTLEIHPKISLITPDTVLFSTDNRIQYQEGWTQLLKEAWLELGLSFSHLSQLDIAVDQMENGQFDFIKKWVKGTYRKVGSAKLTVEWEEGKKGAEPTYFRLGRRSGDKFIRGYYKRQELKHSNKWYVQEFWEKNGFDLSTDREVTRLEICLKRRELKKYLDVSEEFGELRANNLELLENQAYLATLYNTGKEGFFEFVSWRSLARTGNVTRCARQILLDLSRLSTSLLKKITSKVTSDVFKAKISCRQMFELYCVTFEEHYLKLAEEIAYNFNLARWYASNQQRFFVEADYKLRSGGFEFLKNYTSSPKFVQGKLYNLSNFQI